PKHGNTSKGEEKKVEASVAAAKVEKAVEKPVAAKTEKTSYASGSASPAAKKILAEKQVDPSTIKGTGKEGRITKEDAVKAVPSMGTPTGGSRGESRSRSEEHTSELQSRENLVCRLLLEKKNIVVVSIL